MFLESGKECHVAGAVASIVIVKTGAAGLDIKYQLLYIC